MDEVTKSDMKVTDDFELKQKLENVENENTIKSDKNVPDSDTVKLYEPNSALLDFLQDKPIAVQKLLITRGLYPDQKKKVESVFQANEHEISVNRAAIREIIIDLCTKYPEMMPYFSNKTIFIATFGFGYYERSTIVESILASDKPKAE